MNSDSIATLASCAKYQGGKPMAWQKLTAVLKAAITQIAAGITDKDWHLDPQKLVGAIIAIAGAVLFVAVVIRYIVAGGQIDSTAAGIGLGAIATGGGLMGWRNHTDQPGA